MADQQGGRQIVALTSTTWPWETDFGSTIYAVEVVASCSDGTIWRSRDAGEWEQLPSIPAPSFQPEVDHAS